MNTEVKLHEVIERELEVLDDMDIGTEEYRITVEGITKLVDRALEIEKFNVDADERAKTREQELEFKRKQMLDDRIDKIVKHSLTVVSIGTGVAMAIWGTVVSMKFEKEDTFTSLLGRAWVNKTFSFMNKN